MVFGADTGEGHAKIASSSTESTESAAKEEEESFLAIIWSVKGQ